MRDGPEERAARKAHLQGGHEIEDADGCPACETRVIVVEEFLPRQPSYFEWLRERAEAASFGRSR